MSYTNVLQAVVFAGIENTEDRQAAWLGTAIKVLQGCDRLPHGDATPLVERLRKVPFVEIFSRDDVAKVRQSVRIVVKY